MLEIGIMLRCKSTLNQATEIARNKAICGIIAHTNKEKGGGFFNTINIVESSRQQKTPAMKAGGFVISHQNLTYICGTRPEEEQRSHVTYVQPLSHSPTEKNCRFSPSRRCIFGGFL